MTGATWFRMVAAALFCLVVGTSTSARTPLTGGMSNETAAADRLLPPLAASTVPFYGWPVDLGYLKTDQVEATFDDWGCIGSAFHFGRSPYPSFDTPTGSGVQYLFGGALWIGGVVNGDTLVSVGADGWWGVYEMFPTGDGPGNASIEPYAYAGDFTLRGEYADTAANMAPPDPIDGSFQSMHLKIANRATIWDQSPLDKAIVYDMVITNIGDQLIEHGYVGFYFDGDVCYDCNSGGWDDDVTGSLREHGIGYVIDNDGDLTPMYPGQQPTPRVFAFKLLHTSFPAADTAFNWWMSNGTPSLDFGPRMRGTAEDPYRDFLTGGNGTPVGNANKYYILSHHEWDYDQVFVNTIGADDSIWMEPFPNIAPDIANGYDTRFLMSVGPFDLAPDSSVRVIFTTFTADSIHVDPNNLSNLPDDPVAYEANLQLDRMPAVTDVVDTVTPYLLDPDLPPLGLTIRNETSTTADIEWDPWPEGTVDGYDIFVTPVDPAAMPFPGAVPPWYVPASPQLYGSVGRVRSATVYYPPGQFNAINVAHRHGGQTGQLGRSEFVSIPTPAPPSIEPYTFYVPGEQAVVNWGATGADHYNIYKFDAAAVSDSMSAYKPFYSLEVLDDALHELQDSINVDGTWYYYYAMTPYAQVPAGTNQFSEFVADSAIYIVTAVDEYGFESDLATTVALAAPPRTRGTLVLTNSTGAGLDFGNFAYIESFYNTVLAGEDYTIFNIGDSIGMTPYYNSFDDCPTWTDLMPYETVIIDDRFLDNLPGTTTPQWTRFDRYLQSAGRIIYFGSFHTGTDASMTSEPPGWRPVTQSWMRQAFGIDSAYMAGLGYYYPTGVPASDTLFGFNRAEPVGAGFPEVHCDTTAYPIGVHWASFWPTDAPPLVTSFHIEDGSGATPIHLYRALYPSQSLQEGTIVGVTNKIEDGTYGSQETFAFGFHLYYMDPLDAIALLNAIRAPNQAPELRPAYDLMGVMPQRGLPGEVYSFRVGYNDADGDEPYPGFPKVHILDSASQEIPGSPFSMSQYKAAMADPDWTGYEVNVVLSADFYRYWFEARDVRGAAAESGETLNGPIVTGPGGHVLHVQKTGSDATGDGSVAYPFATITRAAQSAANYDTILVGDGVYTGFATQGQSLVIMSENGPDAAIFDGGGIPYTSYRVATFNSFEDSTSVLDGFTIRNVISTAVGGGAIYVDKASPVIRRCRFENNSAPYAAAISYSYGLPLIDSCVFVNNHADSIAGAVYFDRCPESRVRNCTFVRNLAPDGGAAIMTFDGLPVIRNCIFAFNRGSSTVDYRIDQGVAISVQCTDVFGNVGGDWVEFLSPFDGIDGNITADPAFCDPANGDFHITAVSPCSPANNTCAVLMGALPVDPLCLGCCHLRGDADNSGSINIADLTAIVAAVFQGGLQPLCFEEADVDNSGELNIGDVTYLVATLFQAGPLPPSCY